MTGAGTATARLDPFAVPLAGLVAVEASAGTGKTFAITQLYLRLLLEAGFEVGEILVVTYTKAATAELRERLRAKLVAVRTALERGVTDDPFSAAVLERTRDRAAAARTIARALHGFDEAAVFTIHGFCQRVLADSAFESGILFDTTLVPDERELLQEVVDDFWRRELYGASPGFVRWAIERERMTPDALAALAGAHARRPYRRVEAPADPGDVDALEAGLAATWTALRERWATDWPPALQVLLGTTAIRKHAYREATLPEWGPVVEAFLVDDVPNPELPKPLQRLRASAIAGAARKGQVAPTHPLFDACEALALAAERVASAYEAHARALEARLVATAGSALAARKRERGVQSYDDLVSGLATALGDPTRGPALAAAIRGRYRAALIDEFQDTDPVQYDVVRRVWGGSEAPVVVVGDPKQAIYGFRGADVFTYFQARGDAGPRAYHLDRNWRSVPDLIRAVNALFAAATPFVVREIPFFAAEAAEQPERTLVVEGDAPEPLRLWLLEPSGTKEERRAAAAETAAREIARLVALGQAGRARLGGEPVHGGHVAVLVRRNAEGRAMRERLLALGVPSVQQAVDSVFASREAVELERLLLAIAHPGRAPLVRAALATELLGVGGAEILALDDDEREWERRAEAFHDYRHLWRTRGFAAMLRECLRAEGVPTRLLAFEDGERRLTNLFHLLELLQAEWLQTAGGIDALVEWLADARRAAAQDDEEQQLRLESDERLVKIVTVHKSKGLEYPIVFCPFLWDGVLRAEKDRAIVFHETDGDPRATLALGVPKGDARRAAACREELAEYVRLLYVAVTRAEHRCYVAWGHFADAATSPLAWLLHGPDAAGAGVDPVAAVRARWEGLSDEAFRRDLDALAARSGGTIAVERAPRARPVVRASRPAAEGAPAALRPARPVPGGWEITSFTRLARGLDPERPDHDVARVPLPPGVGERPRDRFAFPGGARAGSCLHGVLERVDYTADAAAWSATVRHALRGYGFEAAWEPVVLDLVAAVVATPLDAGGAFRLDRVPPAARVNELEFHHPLAPLDATALARVLRAHEFGGPAVREALGRSRVEAGAGFMKGFIDLVCACDGRYWLIDFKSNRLGDAVDDYGAERLESVVAQEGYWLQYLLYTVVVHRFLRRRILDYDYDRHVGGVRYLFLRGMDPARGTATGVYQDRPSRAVVEAVDRLLAGGGG